MLLALLALALPIITSAQTYSNTPIIISSDAEEDKPGAVPGAGFPNFPENAITRVGENTTGQHVDAPANPPNPAVPENPSAGKAPESPTNPNSPTPPANPVSKLWPNNTVEIFLPACINFHPQLVVPCTCVITKLMVEMPHDEFLKKSEDGTIEQDSRLTRIRTECATTPKQRE